MLKKISLFVFAALFLISCKSHNKGMGGDNDVVDNYTEGYDKVKQDYLRENIGDRIFFAYDSSAVDSDGKEILQKQINWWKENGTPNLIIEGHCDERGTREYNLALGARRAEAVKAYMIRTLGVDSAKVSTISYGKERPVSSGDDEDARKKNRRGVTVVLK
jgi:peptidoglycan-associated lipoprotein